MTTHAVVYLWLFIHIGVILVATSYFTLGAALAPALTERARTVFARRPWLPTVIGLGISIPWVLLAIVLVSQTPAFAKFIGVAMGGLWVLVGLIGGAGIAQHIGRSGASESVSWTQTFRGGLFITLTWVLPIVGWLIVLPMTLAAGIGCMVIGIFTGREKPAQAIETSVAAV